MRIVAAAEEAVMIYVAEKPGEQVLEEIRLLSDAIAGELGEWVTDLVPSFTSLMVYYDISRIDYHQFRNKLAAVVDGLKAERDSASARCLELPVYYGEEVAADLERVSRLTGLTASQVTELHSQQEVRVYALGFRPGFGFMGTLPENLQVARLDTPRKKVPRGAVAITEGQTAVYPDVSPGGWNIIGRCPVPMFDRTGVEPKPFLQVGDRVRFVAINREEFLRLGGELDSAMEATGGATSA